MSVVHNNALGTYTYIFLLRRLKYPGFTIGFNISFIRLHITFSVESSKIQVLKSPSPIRQLKEVIIVEQVLKTTSQGSLTVFVENKPKYTPPPNFLSCTTATWGQWAWGAVFAETVIRYVGKQELECFFKTRFQNLRLIEGVEDDFHTHISSLRFEVGVEKKSHHPFLKNVFKTPSGER